ncbi:phage terminase large subunit-like protein [Methylobacterium sp. R2-1]|nr:phage terminase large subunit-like protein [Methylobacterium sp. R2-1]
MIQEFFWLVPKKNSKSSGAAAIMVTVLIVNRRPLAEALLVAPTKEIANIAYKQAWGIIQADPELAKLFHGQHHVRTITHRNSGASLQIKAADTDVITGSKATYTLIDETHVFAKKPRAADVFVEVRGALAARPDGFLIQVTTQSKDTPSGVFKQELETARKVRDGEMQLPLLPVLYELPAKLVADGGWKDRKLWPLVNPNMGRSVDETFLANQLLKAEQEGGDALALLASQHFNVQIGMGLGGNWPGAEFWGRGTDTTLTLDALLERSEVVCIGIDGGGLDDLFGLTVLGRDRLMGVFIVDAGGNINIQAVPTMAATGSFLQFDGANFNIRPQ